MGDRSVITTKNTDIGVYIHWCSPRLVLGICRLCEVLGYRYPEDDEYGYARFVQTACNYFPDGLSVGVFPDVWHPGDNGIFIINKWRIVGWYGGYDYRNINGNLNKKYMDELLLDIYKAQPEKTQELYKETQEKRKLLGQEVQQLEVPDEYIEDLKNLEILPYHSTKKGRWIVDEIHPKNLF